MKEEKVIELLKSISKVDAPPYFETNVMRKIRNNASATEEHPGFFSRFAILFSGAGLTMATLILVVVFNAQSYRLHSPTVTAQDVYPSQTEEVAAVSDTPVQTTEADAKSGQTLTVQKDRQVVQERRVSTPPPLPASAPIEETIRGSADDMQQGFRSRTNFRAYMPLEKEKQSVDSLKKELFGKDTLSSK